MSDSFRPTANSPTLHHSNHNVIAMRVLRLGSYCFTLTLTIQYQRDPFTASTFALQPPRFGLSRMFTHAALEPM